MKKSALYRIAQLAVLNSDKIYHVDKLEVLRELMAGEDLALLVEKKEEKENANETV